MTVVELRPGIIDTPIGKTQSVFVVELKCDRTEVVVGATGYQPEGPLTTFFANEGDRRSLDAWSVRLASVRTVDIISIQRRGDGRSDGRM